jgi:hypothetical protein
MALVEAPMVGDSFASSIVVTEKKHLGKLLAILELPKSW